MRTGRDGVLAWLARRLRKGNASATLREGIEALARGHLGRARSIAAHLRAAGPEDHAAFLAASIAEVLHDDATRVAELRRAHRLVPGEAAYAIELARAVASVGGEAEAVELLSPILRTVGHAAANDAQLHYLLGFWLRALGGADAARESFRRALELDPAHVGAAIDLAEAHADVGPETLEARAILQRAGERAADPQLMLRAALRLPPAYTSADEMLETRRDFRHDLEALLEYPELAFRDPVNRVGRTAFLLSYHGVDVRPELELLGRVVRRGLGSTELQRRPERAKHARIGVVCGLFRQHSVGRAILPLLQGLDLTFMEVRAYAIAGQGEDDLTARVRACVHTYIVLPGDLDEAARVLVRDALDILIYPEIGMHPFAYFLAFRRLAPLQVALAGHPDTTGIDSIDVYLSDGDAEPADAQRHYGERLMRVPGLFLPVADLPSPVRTTSVGTAGRYICTQTGIKLHPDFDLALERILDRDPRADIVLFRDGSEAAMAVIQARLAARLGSRVERIRCAGRMAYRDYLDTLQSAAVILDTPHFGGGNTTLEALAMGVPIVTQRGAFLRGRFAATRLATLGLTDCVAGDADEYAEIAVALARTPARRAAVVETLRERAPALVDAQGPAAAFNEAILDLHRGPLPA